MNQKLEYNPTLESVIMVEKAIEKHSGELGKYQLWKILPRKMMYQTFQAIIQYLIESNKIVIDRDNSIVWIWDPKGIRKILKSGVKLR